jgi:AAA+ ATPase superfamily predicted ATPase
VSAFGVGLSVKIGSETRGEMEKKIKSAGRISVFIDEAQRMKTKDLADVLSYFYDRLPQVSFVISGSEVGLVEEILGESDAEHPLYGREILKIVLNRLDKNKANEYLKKGFEQLGLKPSEEELDAAVDELDGLIGWLTLYGYEKGVKKSADALEKTSRNAARIAASELVRFLKKVKNKKLYSSILKNASGVGWDELRVRASKETGRQLNPNSFNLALERLTTYSFIEKKDGKYGLSDPLLLKALFLL